VVTIENAVRIAREKVADEGLQLGEIISARLMDEDNEWCVSFAIIKLKNIAILPDRVFVMVDNDTGAVYIPHII
jgi:hypothetical protein